MASCFFRTALRPKILREGEDCLSNYQLRNKTLQCGIIDMLMMMIIIITNNYNYVTFGPCYLPCFTKAILFDQRAVRVGFVAEKVALIHGFLSVPLFCPVTGSMILPLLYNHISFIHPQPKIGLILAFDMVVK